jgi:hypothetical protein
MSHTGDKMGVQWDSELAIYNLRKKKKAYDSVRYNIFESGRPMKLVKLIKMSLNETYGKPAYVNIWHVSYS